MPMRIKPGERYNPHNSKVVSKAWGEGHDFLNKYMMLPKLASEFDHYELKNLAWVAGMGAGKSTQIHAIVQHYVDAFPDDVNYFQTDSIEVAITHCDLKPIQIIVIDDAAGANDSRLGGIARASATQGFFIIRHDVKDQINTMKEADLYEIEVEMNKKQKQISSMFEMRMLELQKEQLIEHQTGGIILLIWSYQFYSSIDVRFRSFFDCIFVKDYSRDPNLKKILLNNKDILRFLKDITRKNLYNQYWVRNLAIGITKADDFMVLKTEYIPGNSFRIPTFSGASIRQDFITEIYTDLLHQKLELLCERKNVIMGYFRKKYKRNEKFQKYHIAKSELGDLVEEMLYVKRKHIAFYRKYGIEPRDKLVSAKLIEQKFDPIGMVKSDNCTLMYFVERLRTYEVPWRDLGELFKMNHSTLRYRFQKYQSELADNPDMRRSDEFTNFELDHQNQRGWEILNDLIYTLELNGLDAASDLNVSYDFLNKMLFKANQHEGFEKIPNEMEKKGEMSD